MLVNSFLVESGYIEAAGKFCKFAFVPNTIKFFKVLNVFKLSSQSAYSMKLVELSINFQ